MKRLLLACALIASLPCASTAWAQGGLGLDYSLLGAARLLPLGMAISGTAGYGVRVWGDSESGVLYGFARPYATFQTSLLVNRLEVGADLYPVSFFGLRVGGAESLRSTSNLDTLDCSAVYCRGFVGTAYVRAQLLLGYRRFSMMGAFRASWFAAPSTTLPQFGDENSALAGNVPGDRMFSVELAGRYAITQAVSAGTFVSSDHMLGTSASNDFVTGFGRYAQGRMSYLVGAGGYQSSTQSWGFTCFALVSWVGLERIGLE
jgi:hypothetical protein